MKEARPTTVSAGVEKLSANLKAWVYKYDTNPEKDSRPISHWALIWITIATTISAGMYLAWKFQPQQDLGHHMAIAAVVADRGRPESLYDYYYEPFDPLLANSLLYSIGGYLGRLIGVSLAMKLAMTSYLVLMPGVMLYMLRSSNKSAWPALLSVPFCYGMLFIAGVANMLFSAPFFLLALPVFFKAIWSQSRGLWITSSLLLVAVFLGHAQLYLWLGPLTIAMTVWSAKKQKQWMRPFGKALLIALPSILLFSRWYWRTFGPGRTAGGVSGVTAPISEGFGATFPSLYEKLTGLFGSAMAAYPHYQDSVWIALVLLVIAATKGWVWWHNRKHHDSSFDTTNEPVTRVNQRESVIQQGKQPSVQEAVQAAYQPDELGKVLQWSGIATAIAYFLLPEDIQNQAGIASRHVGMALWFVPLFASPPSKTATQQIRKYYCWALITSVVVFLGYWGYNLVQFQQEANGLENVMAKIEPRQRLHYVKLSPESRYFRGGSWWHIEKYYMADGFGFTPDTTGIQSTGTIRYNKNVPIHRIGAHSATWAWNKNIWQYHDWVLTHRWNPLPDQKKMAEQRGVLVASEGDWSLWKTKQ